MKNTDQKDKIIIKERKYSTLYCKKNMETESKDEFTGERFIPEMQDEELELEHIQRYECMKNIVKNKVVLDAACGEGYGSCILAEHANKVIGVDIDHKTISHAREKYKDCKNLCFIETSIDNLQMIDSCSLDMVVSFETIEHVDRDLQHKFADEIKRVLKADGMIIISTPDKEQYSDRYHFNNKFHVAEFYKTEFIDFLKINFKNISVYHQYLEVACFIEHEINIESTIKFCKDSDRYNPPAKYLIAVASNAEIPDISLSIVSLHHREEYNKTLEELNYCRSEAIACRKKANDLDIIQNENKLLKEENDRRLSELYHRMNEINLRDKKLIEKEEFIKKLEEERNLIHLECNKEYEINKELCAEKDGFLKLYTSSEAENKKMKETHDNYIESLKKLNFFEWHRFRKTERK